MTRVFYTLLVLAGVFLGMTGTAFAGVAVTPEDGNLLDLARPIFDAVMSGHYIPAVCGALILTVALLKRYAPGKVGVFVNGDLGGVLSTFVVSFAGALGTATLADATWHWSMFWAAGGFAVGAAGGYAMLKKLADALTASTWYQTKAPSWLKAGLSVVLWVFNKPDAVKDAELAGARAVKLGPAKGPDGTVGKPETF